MPDRDDVLDFLMMGGSVRAAADRFGMPQSEVSEIIRDETARYADATAAAFSSSSALMRKPNGCLRTSPEMHEAMS